MFHDGKLSLPNGPALGVSLDRQKLAVLADLYEKSAVKDRDDTAYMKLVDTSYERRVPLW